MRGVWNKRAKDMGREDEKHGMNGKGVQKGGSECVRNGGWVCAECTRNLLWVCAESRHGLGSAWGEGIMCKECRVSVQGESQNVGSCGLKVLQCLQCWR